MTQCYHHLICRKELTQVDKPWLALVALALQPIPLLHGQIRWWFSAVCLSLAAIVFADRNSGQLKLSIGGLESEAQELQGDLSVSPGVFILGSAWRRMLMALIWRSRALESEWPNPSRRLSFESRKGPEILDQLGCINVA